MLLALLVWLLGASAVVVAAYRRLVGRGLIDPEERCVLMLSGSGLKSGGKGLLGEPPTA